MIGRFAITFPNTVGDPLPGVPADVGKVTLKSNFDEALSDEFLLKNKGDEALNDGFP